MVLPRPALRGVPVEVAEEGEAGPALRVVREQRAQHMQLPEPVCDDLVRLDDQVELHKVQTRFRSMGQGRAQGAPRAPTGLPVLGVRSVGIREPDGAGTRRKDSDHDPMQAQPVLVLPAGHTTTATPTRAPGCHRGTPYF